MDSANIVLNSINQHVLADSNDYLLRAFVVEEVKGALFGMHPNKYPGPNGFSSYSYQRHWDIVKDSVTSHCLKLLNNDFDLSSINHTLIALIPKANNSRKMSEFRPISHCNAIYKIVTRCLANRMKFILDVVVSKYQSAFFQDRLITNNAIVGFKSMHKLKSSYLGNSGFLALKLEKSKSYDWVEWGFIRDIMTKTGFTDAWVKKKWKCISSVSFSILINGDPCIDVTPKWGLRQSCLLSPYLFILCSEGLSSLIQDSEKIGSTMV